MFDKFKIKKIKNKITNAVDNESVKQLYNNSSQYIKNDEELCNIIFNKNKSLLSILPSTYQMKKLSHGNFNDLIFYVSNDVCKNYLKNNLSDNVISIYIQDFSDVIIDYALENVSLFNNDKINSITKKRIIELLKSNNSLQSIINNIEFLKNEELVCYCVDLDNSLLSIIPSNIKKNYFLSKIPYLEISNIDDCQYLKLYSYLTQNERVEIFSDILKKRNGIIKHEELKILFDGLTIDNQKKIVVNNFKFIKYCDNEVQLYLFNIDNDLFNYLNQTMKVELINNNPNLVYKTKDVVTDFFSFKDLNNINVDNIKINEIIKSPVFNAKGSLLQIESSQGYYDMLFGINQYTKSQYDFFQKMSDEQIARLCMYDVNYIMILANVDEKNINNAKVRIKNIHKLLFGENILNNYSNLIDLILDNYKGDCLNNYNCILDSLKIIFNKEIVKNNSINLIEDYILSNVHNNPNKQIFNKIIENAYGSEANSILKSRNKLNEHNINSLEIFNPLIIKKFGIGLIHDLISYNISNMSYFLSLVKDEKKLFVLSDLYELESNIYGKNVSTFQRTLNDYEKMEKLLIDIGENKLSDEELNNLYSVIINRNYGNILKKEDLINYENIVKDKLLNKISNVNDIEYIKENICSALFGINFYNNIEKNDRNAYSYLNLYNASNTYVNDFLTENEKIMMDFLNIICNEKNKTTIIELVKNLFNENNILGNIDFVSAIDKIQNNQEKLLNDNLITTDKLEDELEKKTGKVIKLYKDEVPIYILNGIDFGMLRHNISGTNNDYIGNLITKGNVLDNIDTFEEQFGSSTISMWYLSNNNEYSECLVDNLSNNYIGFGYSKIPDHSIVAMDIGNGFSDVRTEHASKLATSSAKNGTLNFDAVNTSKRREEISLYRKLRNQQLLNNENKGGRFDFDYFCGSIYVRDFNKLNELNLSANGFNLYEEAKKRKIPIILINEYAYAKKIKEVQNIEVEKGITK